jgi:hypothetical protein
LEAPCHRVLRVRCQLRRVKGAEGEAESSDTELGVESPVGVRADAAKAQRTTASQQHPGEAKRHVASEKTRGVARREEEKKRCVARRKALWWLSGTRKAALRRAREPAPKIWRPI